MVGHRVQRGFVTVTIHVGRDDACPRVALIRPGIAGHQHVAPIFREETFGLVTAVNGKEVVIARCQEEAHAVAAGVVFEKSIGCRRCRALSVVGEIPGNHHQ